MKDKKDIIAPVVKRRPASEVVANIPAVEAAPKEFDISRIFIVKPANQWLKESKSQPIPKMLYGPLWFQNEWCILFADSGIGKSILAVQIAEAISDGRNDYKDLFPVEVEPQPVLFFDYELSAKQFEKRYSRNYQDHFNFNKNFLRVEINKQSDNIDDFNSAVYDAIESAIIKYGSKVVIIDNITAMSMYSTDSAKDAIPLINRLMRLKNKLGVSLLTLHHTPKRDKTLPLNDGQLAGSKMFSNFCDSVFAIGVSAKDDNLKYIKQIKIRSGEHIFGSENVIVGRTQNPDNFLRFIFEGTGSEREHLKELTDKEKKDMDTMILDMIKEDNSLSLRACAEKMKESGFATNAMYISRLCERNGITKSKNK